MTRGLTILSQTFLAGHRLFSTSLTSELRLADLTAPGAYAFGITAELSATSDYTAPPTAGPPPYTPPGSTAFATTSATTLAATSLGSPGTDLPVACADRLPATAGRFQLSCSSLLRHTAFASPATCQPSRDRASTPTCTAGRLSLVPLPELDVAKIHRHCRQRVPADALHQVRRESDLDSYDYREDARTSTPPS